MKKRVLILAKTEPVPSKKYVSTVCTAGITDEGEFIRLYPIPYELFCDKDRKFSKYDWIEVECEKSDDSRTESYKVKGDIRIVGHVDTDYNWMERNRILLPKCSCGLDELKRNGASLGLIKPSELIEFSMDDKPDFEEAGNYNSTLQMIFDTETGVLKKMPIPAKMDRYFRYTFKCEGDASTHRIMCEDWELYQSWRSWHDQYGSDEEVWTKLHDKFFNRFRKEKDLHFFVGTHNLWKTWIIIGVYYPPKTKQRTLF